MNLYDTIDGFMESLANFLWATPLVILLLGGGFYFSIINFLRFCTISFNSLLKH